ncbi:MAG TPA: hypothetical protein PLX23_04900 [Candidatus Hydrogenedens sp.]|nr:hypothetical protein [Candidatus Hydrogenedens sp.]
MNMKFNSAIYQLLIILLIVPITFVYAQQKNADKNPEKKPSEESAKEQPETAQPPSEEEITLPGDVIYFKSGKKMQGVQVLRELPDKIEVQVNENLEPLFLPRRMIKSIEYDNIDPLREKHKKEILSKQRQNEDIIPGEELSNEFNQKMRAPLSDETISYNNEGLLKILGELTQKAGVKLEVDQSIQTIPQRERKKSFEIPAGTSLYKFLQTDFATAFPNISITYKYDKIYISLKNSSAPEVSAPTPPQLPNSPAAPTPPVPPTAPPPTEPSVPDVIIPPPPNPQ